MKRFRLVLAGLALVAVVAWAGLPVRAQHAEIQLCRQIVASLCGGASTSFSTSDRLIFSLITIYGEGPYNIQVQWLGPDGIAYFINTGQAAGKGPYIWRAGMPVQGYRAETVPGSWKVRVLVNGRQIGELAFTLRQDGQPKVWIEAMGPATVDKAGTAAGRDGDTAVGEAAEFKVGSPVLAYVRILYDGRRIDRMPVEWRWTAPSGSIIEERTQLGSLPARQTSVTIWGTLPALEGKVEQPAGTWQVELLLGTASVTRVRFSLTP